MPGPMPVAMPPDAETARRVAQEVLSRPHFDRAREIPPDLRWLDALLAPVRDLLRWIIRHVLVPFFDGLDALHTEQPEISWFFITVLAGLLAVGTAYLIRAFRRSWNERKRDEALLEEMQAGETPGRWERQAREAAQAGDFALALRLLLRACLLHVETARGGRVRESLTNREYLRRLAGLPVHALLARLVELLDGWYGGQPRDTLHWEQGLEAGRRILAMRAEGNRAA